MTRFQSKALPGYQPQTYQSPMAGIWNMISMWYSTSPQFRKWLADLFTSEDKTPSEKLSEIPQATAGELPVFDEPTTEEPVSDEYPIVDEKYNVVKGNPDRSNRGPANVYDPDVTWNEPANMDYNFKPATLSGWGESLTFKPEKLKLSMKGR